MCYHLVGVKCLYKKTLKILTPHSQCLTPHSWCFVNHSKKFLVLFLKMADLLEIVIEPKFWAMYFIINLMTNVFITICDLPQNLKI